METPKFVPSLIRREPDNFTRLYAVTVVRRWWWCTAHAIYDIFIIINGPIYKTLRIIMVLIYILGTSAGPGRYKSSNNKKKKDYTFRAHRRPVI